MNFPKTLQEKYDKEHARCIQAEIATGKALKSAADSETARHQSDSSNATLLQRLKQLEDHQTASANVSYKSKIKTQNLGSSLPGHKGGTCQ